MRVAVAFASERHAREALAFMRAASIDMVVLEVSPGATSAAFARLLVDVGQADVQRLTTLAQGLHGIMLAPDAAA